jgi:hypothetical protein
MALLEQPFTEAPRRYEAPRHVKVTGPGPAFGFEPCEDVGCTVEANGIASSCGRTACPNCGYGGTNLSTIQLVGGTDERRRCHSCGHSWVPGLRPVYVLTRAEIAECTCPDLCERDHSNE